MTTSPVTSPSPTATIAAVLPDYEVSRELGRGAMGVVYLGRHRRLRRDVAIKELAGPLADDAEVRARFLVEARTLAALDHPHVVPVYDYVEEAGRCLLIMEALPGGTAWDRFAGDGITLPRACALALATCSGLQHAHEHGVLHRDIKPENLLFAASGDLKVSDFGIAKVLDGGHTLATMDGSVLGTPAYMAPEQAEGADIGPSADVYAVATILYEFASGRIPFEGDSPMSLLVQRITVDPSDVAEVAPAVPEPIAAVIMAGLRRDPAARTASAEAFGCDLATAAVEVWGDGWLEQSGVPVSGSRPILAAAAPARTLPPVDRRPGDATVAPSSGRIPPPVPVDEAGSDETRPLDPDRPAAATVAPAGMDPAALDPVVVDSAPEGPGADRSPAVKPVAGRHTPGFDPAVVDRDQLVRVEKVVRQEVPVLVPAVAAVVGLILALLFVVGSTTPVEPLSPAGGPALVGAIDDGGTVVVDLAQPIGLGASGIEGATTATVMVSLAGVEVASQEVPLVDGVAELDFGLAGWLVNGPAEATVTVVDAGGAVVAESQFVVRNEREPWRTAQVPILVIAALFGLGALESQSRRHPSRAGAHHRRRRRRGGGRALRRSGGAALVGLGGSAHHAGWRRRCCRGSGAGGRLAHRGARPPRPAPSTAPAGRPMTAPDPARPRGGTMRTMRALLLIAVMGVLLAGCSGGEVSDALEVEASIDGTPIDQADASSPLRLDPAEEATLVLDIENPTDEAIVLERVRLEGELLGMNFLTYDVRVRTTVPAGATQTLEVPLDFFDLENQASGYLRANLRTYDADKVRVSTNEFAVDVEGSPWSTMNLFAYALFVLTLASLAKNVRDAVRHQLPDNRFHRGVRFLVPGLGFGLLLSVAFSILRVFPLPTIGWVPLTLLPAAGAFAFGYFFTPGARDDEPTESEENDDADDDELAEDLLAAATGRDTQAPTGLRT